MTTLNGMKVFSSAFIQEVPKLQLSSDFHACSGEMKQSMNTWLRERFGTYLPCYVIGESIFMHPKHFAELKISGALK